MVAHERRYIGRRMVLLLVSLEVGEPARRVELGGVALDGAVPVWLPARRGAGWRRARLAARTPVALDEPAPVWLPLPVALLERELDEAVCAALLVALRS